MAARVYVVDGRDVVRAGVRQLLESSPDADVEIAGESATLEEAVARIPAGAADVVVTAADLPDGRGLDLCRALRTATPAPRVLIVASRVEKPLLLGAIDAGASGVLPEDTPARDLVAAVMRAASGDSLLDAYAIRRLLDRMPPDAVPRAALARLTPRQLEILDLIGEGASNRDIATRLSLAEKTVKNNVTRILSELGVERRTQLAVIAARLRDELG